MISRKDIEQSQARSLDELLRRTAGVHVSRTGGYGKDTSVYIRGTESDHVLVLIDGVRAGSATLGSFAWSNFTPEQIERIELVRGPRASLYGSDAIGGVVQIFTRKNRGANVRLGYGENNTQELSAGYGGGTDWKYNVQAARFDTDGIPTLKTDTEDHGYDNNQLTLGLSGKPTKTTDLQINLNYSDGENEHSQFTGDSEFENRIASARIGHRISDRWSHNFTVGQALDRQTSHSPFTPSTISTLRNSYAWQNDVVLGEGLLTLGADHWIDRVTKDASGTINERVHNSAVFLQHQFDALDSQWVLGARRDRHSEFGHENTWNIGWGHDLNQKTRLRASHGTAFKAPTVNDLFWPNSVSFYDDGTGTLITSITQGNPNVRPETSYTTEIGIDFQARNDLSVSASIYRTKVNDLIRWQVSVPAPATELWVPTNVADVSIKGAELGVEWSYADWTLGTSLTFLDAKDDATDEQLDRRPRRSATIQLGKDIGPGHLQFDTTTASERNDRNASALLSGYGVTNVTYQQGIWKNWSLQARVENLFDRDYTLARSFSSDYSTLGRTGFLSLSYQTE